MGRGNPKGTNRGGGRKPGTRKYIARPDGTVWVEYKKRCKRVGYKHHSGYYNFTKHDKEVPVHRFIAEQLIPNPDNLPFVDHINRVRDDNRVENLRWVDRQTNNDNRCFGSPEAMISELKKLGYDIFKHGIKQ